MNKFSKIIASFLRAGGFVALFLGGFYAFTLSFAGGIRESKVWWVVFIGGILAVWFGDRLKNRKQNSYLVGELFEKENSESIKRIFLAFLFALIGPGGGQAYLGEMKKAYVYGGVYLSLPILSPLVLRVLLKSSDETGMRTISVFTACTGTVILISFLDAIFTAIRLRKADSPPIQWKRGLVFAMAIEIITSV
jgi:hypothetical protein